MQHSWAKCEMGTGWYCRNFVCVYLWDVEAVWLSVVLYKETFQYVEFGERERERVQNQEQANTHRKETY